MAEEAASESERIEESVEDQAKAEMGQSAGVGRSESWEEAARRVEAKIRYEMAGWVGAPREARWGEVAQGVESRTKEAFGGWAGATASDDWETVGRKIEGRIRERAAHWSGAEAGREVDWDEIGRRVEQRMRGGAARWAGAPEDADWGTVADRFKARIGTALSERRGPETAEEAAGPAREGEATMGEPEAEGEGVRREEFRVSGNELLAKVKELIHQGNIRRVIIKQDERVLIEFPLTLGIVGAVLAPTLAAVGAIAALVAETTIVVERRA